MFNIRLKELRESKGLSQYAFAAEFNISQSTVGNWEAGTRTPDSKTLSSLADYFGVSVDYILGRTDKAEKPKSTHDTSDMKVALFGGDGEVTDEMWEEVINFVDYVKAKHKDKRNRQ